ncbi:DHA2 family efflux MFS transporter permease subunit [Micromonospora sp. DT31]|uniref:DHA2 family efflux MFS transporter permease subunit n=1 Tax=Micromonospora sp. DT31 TaxID=3393434 RepID=UPI003CEA633C
MRPEATDEQEKNLVTLKSSPRVSSPGLALAVLCTMQLMVILDGTIVTVALPRIQRDLGFDQAGLAWVMNSYLIAFAGLLLLAGRLGDLIGSKNVFLAGLALFTGASVVCGIANTQEVLVAGRFVQGVGGALASAVILGMIVGLFPEQGAQAKAIGIYSFVSASGAAIGLIAGGVITQTLGWHWAFLVNVPIGIAALAFGVRLLITNPGLGMSAGADVLGAVLVTSGLSLAVFTIVRIADESTSLTETLVFGAIAVALLVGFVVRQALAAKPLLPLRLFRKRQVSAANIIIVLVFSAGFGFQFLTALYMQRVLGFNALQTGLAFLPAPLVIGTISVFFTGRLTARFGQRTLLIVGLIGIIIGLSLLSRAPVDGDYVRHILPTLIIQGAGMGVGLPALMMLAMSGADPADAGVASGLTNTAQQAGAAIGTAVLATLATSRGNTLVDRGEELLSALRGGYSVAFLAAASFVVIALIIAFVALRPAAATAAPEPALDAASVSD